MRSRWNVGVVEHYAKSECLCPQRRRRADTAEPDKPESLHAKPAHFCGDIDCPAKLLRLRIERKKLAVKRKGESERMIGDFLGTVVGHIANRNSGCGCGLEINAIET